MHRQRRRAALIALPFFVLACTTSGAGTTTSPQQDAAQIRALLDSTAAAWNRGELSGYMAAYADSTTSLGADGFVRGKAATEQVMRQGFWRTGRPAQDLHYEHVDVRMLGADHALVTGEFVLTGGGHPERTGWFTTIWARTEKGWRMIHDHSS